MSLSEQRISRRRRANRRKLSLQLRDLWAALRQTGVPSLGRGARGAGRVLREALPYVGVALIVAAVPITAAGLYRYLTSSDHFGLAHVDIVGNDHADEEELLTLAGVVRGQNLLLLDTDEVEAEVEKHPWVRAATVEAELPDRLTIRVSERRPIAVASLPQLHLVDDRGVVFKRVRSDEVRDLPVITGVTREELADPEQVDEAQRRLREAVRVADWYVLHDVAKAHKLGEIHVDPLFGYTVVTRDDAVEVRLGQVDDREELAGRLDRLGHVLNDARARKARVSLVRLDDQRDPRRVTVKLEYAMDTDVASAEVPPEQGAPAERDGAERVEKKSKSVGSAKKAPRHDHILP